MRHRATGPIAIPTVRRARRAALAVALLCLPLVSGWTVKGTEVRKDYYSISGASRAELAASVRWNAPKSGQAYGIGFIEFHPDYSTRSGDGLCLVDTAEVGLRVVIKLPRWQGRKDAPRSVASFATRFSRFIEAHEMQHVAIAKRYARRMEASLRSIKPDASCWQLRGKAADVVRKVKAEHIAAQKAFDDRTRKQIKDYKRQLFGQPEPKLAKAAGVSSRRRRG